MKAATASSLAAEINRLHAEAVRFAADSHRALASALVSVWRAGQLLTQEKKRVRRMMGAGAWCQWLEQNFAGNERTAQRHIRLAAAVSDPAFLRGLSIQQAYLRLGIATEPKSRPRPAHRIRTSPPLIPSSPTLPGARWRAQRTLSPGDTIGAQRR